MACLGLYRDPVIARNTAESDLRLADLARADAPVSLYLVVPPSDLTRTRPLIRLMLNQIGRRLTESMHAESKHRLLLLLDEFPSLGRLELFETALAFIAGYGMKAFLIAQSLNQLEKAYGVNNAILDNCHVRITYGANDDRTAKRISDLLGQATEKKTQKSYSGSGLWPSSRTETEQEYGRPLLTPGEVTQLPPDDGILLVGGLLPYRARKVRYFLDRRFRERAGRPRQTARKSRRASYSSERRAIGTGSSWTPSPRSVPAGRRFRHGRSPPRKSRSRATAESGPPTAPPWPPSQATQAPQPWTTTSGPASSMPPPKGLRPTPTRGKAPHRTTQSRTCRYDQDRPSPPPAPSSLRLRGDGRSRRERMRDQ